MTTVADHIGAAGAILRLRYVDGNPNVTVAGQDRASGEVNYLLGDDSSSWRRGLSQYRGVVYRDLWPGIDMKLRTDSGALKYEFHVRPGARVSDIRLAYEGVDRLTAGCRKAAFKSEPLSVYSAMPRRSPSRKSRESACRSRAAMS